MSITQFEAAAIFDYEKNLNSQEMTAVILDTDALEVGVCICSAKGQVSLIGKTGIVENAAELRDTMLGGQSSAGIFLPEWKKQLEHTNEQLEKYFRSANQMDAVAVHIPALKIEWKCSLLEKQFSNTKEKLIQVFEETDTILSKNGIDDDKIRILLIGEWADYYMFLYSTKEYFSFDPFMEDTRFVKEAITKKTSDLVAEIEKKIADAQTIGYDIGVKYFELSDNGELIEKTEWLSKKEQPSDMFKRIHYCAPIYVGNRGSLLFEVNGKKSLYTVPITNKNSGSNVEISLLIEDDKLKVKMRKLEEPEKIYDIKLDLR